MQPFRIFPDNTFPISCITIKGTTSDDCAFARYRINAIVVVVDYDRTATEGKEKCKLSVRKKEH